MADYLNDLKIALADLRARYPIGEQPPPLVLARILELGRLIAGHPNKSTAAKTIPGEKSMF
jgi:hypothetical protein